MNFTNITPKVNVPSFYSGEKDAIGDKKEKDKKKGEYYAALQLEGLSLSAGSKDFD